jgi:hypothetical protein
MINLVSRIKRNKLAYGRYAKSYLSYLCLLALTTSCLDNTLITSVSQRPELSSSSTLNKQSLNGTECLEIDDERKHFYESSGFRLPADAEIVLSCDDHGGFHGDGEYYLVFDVTEQDIQSYLQTSFWNQEWQRGAVPKEVSFHTALSKWANNTFNSSQIWYIAENRNTMIPFHNGRLMLIDTRINRVFYSQWDF